VYEVRNVINLTRESVEDNNIGNVICLMSYSCVFCILHTFSMLDFTKTFLLHIIGCHGRDSMVAGFTPTLLGKVKQYKAYEVRISW
jgi:hypothetical protein